MIKQGREKTEKKTKTKKAPAQTQAVNLDSPEYYVNRELSWLKFNLRVLREAEVETTPLAERLKFAAIYSSNLDEFFMVRVAGLWEKLEENVTRADAVQRAGA